MFQVRIHGRGGQGVVTAADLLSVAVVRAGQHAQAFPSFGSERTGAPVVSYCRMDDRPIRLREPILRPDALIVQDVSLLNQVEVLSGLPSDAYVLVNTEHSIYELGLGDFAAAHDASRIITVPATQIALKHVGLPLPNLALLGGFAALTGRVTVDHVASAVYERFPARIAAANVAAVREAASLVGVEGVPA